LSSPSSPSSLSLLSSPPPPSAEPPPPPPFGLFHEKMYKNIFIHASCFFTKKKMQNFTLIPKMKTPSKSVKYFRR
jgi:hypothetical protein